MTTEQLDDLEHKARAVADAPVKFHATESGSEDERMAERKWRNAADDMRTAMTPDVTLQLVAIARAARLLVAKLESQGFVSRLSDAADPLYAALGDRP